MPANPARHPSTMFPLVVAASLSFWVPRGPQVCGDGAVHELLWPRLEE